MIRLRPTLSSDEKKRVEVWVKIITNWVGGVLVLIQKDVAFLLEILGDGNVGLGGVECGLSGGSDDVGAQAFQDVGLFG